MELLGGGISKAAKERNQRTSYLQLYLDPPEENITLQEFESIAKTRQRILQEVGNLKEKHIRGDIDDEQHHVMMREKTKDLTISTSESAKEKDKEKIRHDLIGHYILRLAYCESEETRRWFLSQEVDLLRYRLLEAGRNEVDSFFERYKDYFPFEKTRLTTLKPNLQNNIINFYKLQENDTICYKIYFTELLDLVQKRAVIIDKGFVYICAANKQMLISLICNKFRAILSHDLTLTRHHVWRAKDDERINPIIKNIRSKYLGDDFTNLSTKIEQISIKEIDTVSKESFPPCMRHLHESLRSNHHLRHFGRLQYNLFLKSIGISMEQSLEFWREEFTKIMDHEKFDKNYAYNIRHSYGKEGKRTNYTPYSCMKIITTNQPSVGDHHGCPFRHWDDSHIRQMLAGHGLSTKSIQSIETYYQKGHYQLSCQKYFEITHGLNVAKFSLEHPTQYFIESRQARGAGVGEPPPDRSKLEENTIESMMDDEI